MEILLVKFVNHAILHVTHAVEVVILNVLSVLHLTF
jgi:hypothetical protein